MINNPGVEQHYFKEFLAKYFQQDRAINPIEG
jgi:hypothetical protein